MTPWPFLDATGPLAFAHRGGALDAPENSVEAFEQAVAAGYRYLETDVHLSADGVVVALHDEDLDRVANRTGAVNSLSWSELQEAKINGGGTIPRLIDLLERFPDARFNIDPKSDEVLEPLLGLIQQLGVIDRVCIGSFSDRRIARAQERLGPRLCTSPGPQGIAKLRAASVGMPVGQTRFGCVQVPPTARGVSIVTPRFVEAMHDRGIQVHVWTINDADEMHRLLDLGVDGLMTDKLLILRDVLTTRGSWLEGP